MPVEARRKLAALALCLIGMGVLDHALRLLADMAAPDYVPGSGFEALAAVPHLKSRVIGLGEIIGVTVLYLLALLLALTAGRSFLGSRRELHDIFRPARDMLRDPRAFAACASAGTDGLIGMQSHTGLSFGREYRYSPAEPNPNRRDHPCRRSR